MYTLKDILEYILTTRVNIELKDIDNQMVVANRNLAFSHSANDPELVTSNKVRKIGGGTITGVITGGLLTLAIPSTDIVARLLALGTMALAGTIGGIVLNDSAAHKENRGYYFGKERMRLEQPKKLEDKRHVIENKRKMIEDFFKENHSALVSNLLLYRSRAKTLEQASQQINFLLNNSDLDITEILVAIYTSNINLLCQKIDLLNKTRVLKEQVDLKFEIGNIRNGYREIYEQAKTATIPRIVEIPKQNIPNNIVYFPGSEIALLEGQEKPVPGFNTVPRDYFQNPDPDLGLPSYLKDDDRGKRQL